MDGIDCVPTVTLYTVMLPTVTLLTVTLHTLTLPSITLPTLTLPTVTLLPHRHAPHHLSRRCPRSLQPAPSECRNRPTRRQVATNPEFVAAMRAHDWLVAESLVATLEVIRAQPNL